MPTLPFVVVPHALGTLSADQVASNPISHLGEFDSVGMTWKNLGGTPIIRGDFGSAKPIDFVSVIHATNITSYRVRLGDTQAAVDGTASYDSGSISFVNPSITREDGLYSSHLELPSVQTRRWWRIDFTCSAAGEAAFLVMGQKITPANYYSPGWGMGVEDLGEIDIGRYGIPATEEGLIFRTLNFSLGWMSETDFEGKFRPLVEKLGKRGVALWCFDPTANAYRQAKTYMGWLRNALVARHSVNTPAGIRYEQEFEILSMI